MSECNKCKGTGFIVEGETVCQVCHGSGKVKSVDLTSLNEEDLPGLLSGDLNCKKCGGTGKIPVKKRCEQCNGSGVIVHKLHNACDLTDVEIGDLYEGVVGDVVAFGAFVYLNSNIKGLAHSSKLKREPSHADKMVVEVRSIQANGNIELVPVSVSNYFLVDVKKDLPRRLSSELTGFVGKQILISGEVIQVKQTGGPTIFTISDEGGFVHCAAFEKAGERAYPEIDNGMIVEVMGEANLRNNEIQIEVQDISLLPASEAVEIKKQIDGAIRKRAKPSSTKFLVQSQVLEKLHPEMVKVAEEIRYAVLTSRRIIL